MHRGSGLVTDAVLERRLVGSDRPQKPEDDAELVFRAVTTGNERRGIRLEAIFWKTISTMAAASGRTLGQQVSGAVPLVAENGNLASTLRVQAAQWLHGRISELERVTAAENIFAIVHASPSPAFVLSTDKRIVQFNQPFLNFVRARLLTAESNDLMRAARLSLDTQLEQVTEQLRKNPKTPIATGFALGVAERRVRGQLKLVLAPTPGNTMVIAYITQL
jgi:predicted DNA-binding ribbon-helix-helix protein